MNVDSKNINISITYCVPCDYSDYALMVSNELIKNFQHDIKALTLVTGSKGVFEVKANDELIFSKKEQGRFPESGEVVDLFTTKIMNK